MKSTRKLYILYIDDNETNIKLMEHILYKRNIYVNLTTFTCPIKGINNAKIAYPPYDLILLDINMPKINGFDSFNILHREVTNNPIFIAVTCNNKHKHITHAKIIGFDRYVTKPIFIKSYMEMIDEYIIEKVNKIPKIKSILKNNKKI